MPLEVEKSAAEAVIAHSAMTAPLAQPPNNLTNILVKKFENLGINYDEYFP